MRLVQCQKGHFYDSEKWTDCPYCSGKAGASADQGRGMGANNMEMRVNEGLNTGIAVTGAFVRKQEEVSDTSPTVGFSTRDLGNPPGMGLYQSSFQTSQDDGTTVSFLPPGKGGQQPVVGWLVCTEGCNYGRCYNLHGGKNFIGRREDMDVALTGDETVSRVKHAIIIYEPKQRKFFAQPGESHELFYVNDDVVLSSVQIHDRDVISIGETTLVFVPFCDERFGWERKSASI